MKLFRKQGYTKFVTGVADKQYEVEHEMTVSSAALNRILIGVMTAILIIILLVV